MFLESAILNCVRDSDFFHLLKNHIPVLLKNSSFKLPQNLGNFGH